MRFIALFSALVVGVVAFAAALGPLALRARPAADLPPLFDGTTDVYAVPFAGGAPQRVLRLHGQWAFPVATVDGRSLIAERPTAASGVQLWRVPLDGGPRKRLGSVRVFQQLAWSDDRREYAVWGPGAVTIRRPDGARVRALGLSNVVPSWNGDYLAGERQTRPPSTGWRLDVDVWRADGRRRWSARMPFPVATVSVARDGRRVADVRVHLLELVTPRGRRVLARDAAGGLPPVWTTDGRQLVYTTQDGRLRVLTVATGRSRALASPVRASYPALSPDGKLVYVLRLNDAVNIPK